MIQASIYGRLGTDRKASQTKTGKPMCTASVAVDVSGKEGDPETLWVSVLAFGKNAELLLRNEKSGWLAAMGRLTRSRYTGSGGKERENWTLLVDSIHSSRTVRHRIKIPILLPEWANLW